MPGLGIDIGGSKIALSASLDQRILFEHSIPLHSNQAPEVVIEQLLEYIRHQAIHYGLFQTIAIASAPNLDSIGCVTRWPNHPNWEGIQLVKLLAPLAVQQLLWCDDGTAATIADAHSLDTDNLLHFSLGTGVGGGILFNNQILSDRELGHLIVQPGGLSCSCGRNGCLQAYASGRSLEHHLNVDPTGEDEWFERATSMVAVCISNLVELFSSRVVTLSGGLCARFPEFAEAVSRDLRIRYLKSSLNMPQVQSSPHGNNASLQAALILASENTPHRQVCQIINLR